MIRLVSNADQKLHQLIYEKSARAYYLSVCEHYAKNHITCFTSDMQILITKLGIMISEISTTKQSICYCHTSLRFLCDTVLDNPALKNTFEDIGINQKGNEAKHRIAKQTNIDMQRCVTAYNNLVNRISDKYGLKSLKAMVVRKATTGNSASGTAYPQRQSGAGKSSSVKSYRQAMSELDKALEKCHSFLDGYVRERIRTLSAMERIRWAISPEKTVQTFIDDAYETVGMNNFIREANYLLQYIHEFYHQDLSAYAEKKDTENRILVQWKYTED